MTPTKPPYWLVIWSLVLIVIPYPILDGPLLRLGGLVILAGTTWRLYTQQRCSWLAPLSVVLSLLLLVPYFVPVELGSYETHFQVRMALSLTAMFLEALLGWSLLSGLISICTRQSRIAEAHRIKMCRTVFLVMLAVAALLPVLAYTLLYTEILTELPFSAATVSLVMHQCALWLVAWTYFQSGDRSEFEAADGENGLHEEVKQEHVERDTN